MGPKMIMSFVHLVSFLFSLCSLLFIWFNWLIFFISYWFWFITMKQCPDNDNGHSQDHRSTTNHCHEQLLTGWEHVQLQEATTRPNRMMRWQKTQGKAMRRRQSTWIKGPEMLFDVSWAVGFFFSHFIILLLTRTADNDNRTRSWPNTHQTLLWAPAHRVDCRCSTMNQGG